MVGLDRSTHYRYVQVDGKFLSRKSLLHTVFHILGRYHEHERADRNHYVNIIEKNIIKGIYTIVIVIYVCMYVICAPPF